MVVSAERYATFEEESGEIGLQEPREHGLTSATAQRLEQRISRRDEQYAGAFLDELFQEAKRVKEPKSALWPDNIRTFRGGYSGDPRAPGLSRTQFNNVFRIVNLYVALLTDAKPRIEIGAYRSGTEEVAEWAKTMKEQIEALWTMQEMDRKITRISYDLSLMAKGFLRTIWDPALAWGHGDVSVLRVDPRYVWMDRAEDISRAQFLCYRVPVPLWEVQALFPLRGHLVKADVVDENISDTSAGILPVGVPIKPVTLSFGQGIPKAWVEEWLIRDPTIDGLQMRYPSGRLITRAPGSGIVLADGNAPTEDTWPGIWAEFNATFDPDNPWNTPDVTMMLPLQKTLDNLTRYMEDNAAFLTAGLWIAARRSLDERQMEAGDMLIPRPGRVVWYTGEKPTRDSGAQLPPHMVEVIRMVWQGMESVSGLLDAGGAKVPRGVTAGTAIEQLQASTQAAIRLRSRDVEAGLIQTGQRCIQRVLRHYTSRRVLETFGADGGLRSVMYDPRLYYQGVEDPDERFRAFHFHITPGSSLALSKERQYAFHAALYSMGVIDQEAFLTAIDYPNRESIMRRMAQAQAGIPLAKARVGPMPRGRGTAVTRKLIGGIVGAGNPGGGPAI